MMDKQSVRAEASKLVTSLVECITKLAESEVKEQTDTMMQEILANLPKVVALPPMLAESPLEKLLTIKEIANLLGCSAATVRKRMNSGELAYILEPGSRQRKMPYSWVVEYMYKLPRYTGKLEEKQLVPDGEGLGANCLTRLIEHNPTEDETHIK